MLARLFSSKNKTPPKQIEAHYIWIGPPSAQSNKGVKGHDVACVIEMAKANNAKPLAKRNKIIFDCLEEHVPYYKDLLAQHEIEVRSVQNQVEKKQIIPLFKSFQHHFLP